MPGRRTFFPLCFQSTSSFAADGRSEPEGSGEAARRTVGGEERWCCADGTFMMSCVAGAWSWKRTDKGQEKRVSAGPLEGYATERAPGGFGGLNSVAQRQ